MSLIRKDFKRPPLPLRTGYHHLRFQGDLMLAGFEYLTRFVSEPVALSLAPLAPEGRAVIAMPGFTGSDETMSAINTFLTTLGYRSVSWGLGQNHGYRSRRFFEGQLDRLGDTVARRADETGLPVALVGHSLGGVYAREVARRHPDLIDRVITLGSPAHFGGARGAGLNTAVRSADDLKNTRRGVASLAGRVRASRDEPPEGVPLVSIYSPLDAVVPVRMAKIPDAFAAREPGVPRENLEVACSHMGMAVNSLVLLAIADRLAQGLEPWGRFDPNRYVPLPLRLAGGALYPSSSAVVGAQRAA